MGRRADGQIGLEARRWALLNLGVKGAIELSLLIVHLTQDHVVLQEEFVSHAKSGKSKQEREAMEGSQWPGHVGSEVLGSLLLDHSRGDPQSPWVSPTFSQALQLGDRTDRQAWATVRTSTVRSLVEEWGS